MDILNISDLQVFYGHSQALYDVNMTVEEKAIITLLGANGAGKSTTLRTISGLLRPRGGEIRFQNNIINNLPPHKIVLLGVTQVPEGRELFPNLTVRENLLAGQYTRKNPREMKADWDQVIKLFPILGERMSQAAGTLSGGEQQMLAIGRAFLTNPILLLLDEPSLGLSPILVNLIFESIAEINREAGLTIIVAEQNAMMGLSIAQKGYVLELGRVVLKGTTETLMKERSVMKSYLGIF